MRELNQLAINFREAIRIAEIGDVLLPFKSFPKNCCEHCSVLFGYYLNLIMPGSTVEIIRGVDDSSYDLAYHFWLEVDGRIYDLTLDQFDECSLPVYGGKVHPFQNVFVEDKREYLHLYMLYYFDKAIDLPMFSRALSSVTQVLKGNTRE